MVAVLYVAGKQVTVFLRAAYQDGTESSKHPHRIIWVWGPSCQGQGSLQLVHSLVIPENHALVTSDASQGMEPGLPVRHAVYARDAAPFGPPRTEVGPIFWMPVLLQFKQFNTRSGIAIHHVP